jgi:hypothetical protein
MADLHDAALSQRAELLSVDAELAAALVDAYAAAWRRLAPRLDALTARIADARAAGERVDAGWLRQRDALAQLEAAVVSELAQVARAGNGRITGAQWRAVALAQAHARGLVDLAMGPPPAGAALPWVALNAEAVAAMVGALGDGRPLTALLAELGPAAAEAVREALTFGVIAGEPVGTIARRARQAFGGNLSRALTVARTEVLRAYRRASWATYRANADVVRGWIWLSSLSRRTCAACLAMHGTRHPLTEEFHDHPRGRCCPVPDVRTWAELGYPAAEAPEPLDLGSGEEWFAGQPADVQRAVLGGAKHAAYEAGALDLADLAASTRAGGWGKTLREKSLTEAVGAERSREFIAGSRG